MCAINIIILYAKWIETRKMSYGYVIYAQFCMQLFSNDPNMALEKSQTLNNVNMFML